MPEKLGFKMREQYVHMITARLDTLIKEEASLLEAEKIKLEQEVKVRLGITAMEQEIQKLSQEKARLGAQIGEFEDNIARIRGLGKKDRYDGRDKVGENIFELEVEKALKRSEAYTTKARLEKKKQEMVQELWLLGTEEEVKGIFQAVEELSQEVLPGPRKLEALPKAG